MTDTGEIGPPVAHVEDVRHYLDGECSHISDKRVQRVIDAFPEKDDLWIADIIKRVAPPLMDKPPVIEPDPLESTLAANENARASGCYCADERKPCSYHEGFADGWEARDD